MAKERRSLNGKVVAITGGARGIGKATATALVRKGCRIAIGDLELELAEQTASELGGGTVALPPLKSTSASCTTASAPTSSSPTKRSGSRPRVRPTSWSRKKRPPTAARS